MTLQSPPLLIMNGFGGREEADPYKIVSLMIQSMFPPIKVQSMNLSTCKRIVLFNLSRDPETGEEQIEFRHYGISARQRAVNKGIKRLINNKKVPDMSRFNDLADYILRNESKGGGGAYSSESEIDDIPESKITLPEDYQDKKKNTQVAIKLHELGPRMKLKLVKIEEGFCRGNVTFHAYIQKTKAEVKTQLDSIKSKRELKEKRKREQEQNVRKKQEKKLQAGGSKGADASKGSKREDEEGDDEYVEDEAPVEGAEVDEGVAPGAVRPAKGDDKKKLFANFQKGRVIPNISSVQKRPAGISKGLWRKELKHQLTGSYEKKTRRGMRKRQDTTEDASSGGGTSRGLLGKRDSSTKTATNHKQNTSTFKS